MEGVGRGHKLVRDKVLHLEIFTTLISYQKGGQIMVSYEWKLWS